MVPPLIPVARFLVKRLGILTDTLLALLAVVVAVLIGAATLFVVADVLWRLILNESLGWVIEVCEYILTYIPFLGMAWLVRLGQGHIQVDILLQALSFRARCLLEGVAFILVSLICVFVAYHGFFTTLTQYDRDVMTWGVYPVPKYLIVMAIPAGFTLTAIEFLRLSLERLNSAGRH